MQRSSQQCQAAADAFLTDTTRTLHRRISDLRAMVALDLSSLARAATDQADAVSADLAVEQRLNAKRVVDTIEKMLRRRRRRFRWVRRAGWLAVEWGARRFHVVRLVPGDDCAHLPRRWQRARSRRAVAPLAVSGRGCS